MPDARSGRDGRGRPTEFRWRLDLVGACRRSGVGHEERQVRGNELAVRAGSIADTPLDPYARVMVLGSGLSMVDAWLTLAGRKHQGPISWCPATVSCPAATRPRASGDRPAEIPLGTSLHALSPGSGPLLHERWRKAETGGRRSMGCGPSTRRSGKAGPWKRVGVSCACPPHLEHSPPSDCRRRLHDRLEHAIQSGQITLVAGEYLGLEASLTDNAVTAPHPETGITENAKTWRSPGSMIAVAWP